MWSAPRPLLCNGAVNTLKTIRDNWRRCFPCKVVVKKNSIGQQSVQSRVSRRQPAGTWAWEQRNWTESSLRNWQLQNIGKKGIRLWKEDFMYDSKWQWDCYKSVARIRLVKTEYPSACVMVNCKVCRSAIALYCLQFWVLCIKCRLVFLQSHVQHYVLKNVLKVIHLNSFSLHVSTNVVIIRC
jgi:hypothetical protein